MPPTTGPTTSSVLAAARRLRAEANAAEVGVLLQGIAWCRLHQTDDELDAASWGNTPVLIAGPGAPMVAEFCIPEFAAALNVSTDSGRTLLGQAWELAQRLPRIFDRVQDGDLPVWRARRIAEETMPLTSAAAEFVDAQIAPFAHKAGPVVTRRLIDEATSRFMPARAAEIAAQAADGRYVTVEHDHQSFAGCSSIYGTIDFADALELDQALGRGAEALKTAGDTASLDVRRAAALGALARGQDVLPLTSQVEEIAPPSWRRPARDITLYVHLDAGSEVARVENGGNHLISTEQVAAWCQVPGAHVTVKPVIDLTRSLRSSAYAIPERIREQVVLRDSTCVFPWCSRSSRRCDLDHVVAFDIGGSTCSENLAPLCRRHHRLKTFGGWSYRVITPGRYLWRSPHQYLYQRDQSGTREQTPRPVEPPSPRVLTVPSG